MVVEIPEGLSEGDLRTDYNHFSCLLSSLRDITFWVRRVSVILKTVILPVRKFGTLAVL